MNNNNPNKPSGREFWFDLETTSENEFVVNEIFLEKPDYETDFHVVEAEWRSHCLRLADMLERAIIGYVDSPREALEEFEEWMKGRV